MNNEVMDKKELDAKRQQHEDFVEEMGLQFTVVLTNMLDDTQAVINGPRTAEEMSFLMTRINAHSEHFQWLYEAIGASKQE